MPPRQKNTVPASSSLKIATKGKVVPVPSSPKSRGTKRKSSEKDQPPSPKAKSSTSKSKSSSSTKSTAATSSNKRPRKASAKDVKASAKDVKAASAENEEQEEEEDDGVSEDETGGDTDTPMSAEEAKEASTVWVNRLSRMTPGSAQAAKALKDFADPSLLSKLHWYTRGPKQRTLLLEFCRVFIERGGEVLPEPYEPDVWAAISTGVTTQCYDLATVIIGPNKENSLHLLFRATAMWAANAASSAAFRGIVTYLSNQGAPFIRMLGELNQARQIPWTLLMNGIAVHGSNTTTDIHEVVVLMSKSTAQVQKKEWTTFLREQHVLEKSVSITVSYLQLMTVQELKWLRLEMFEELPARYVIHHQPNSLYKTAVQRVMSLNSTLSRLFLHVFDVLCVWQRMSREGDDNNAAAATAAASSSSSSSSLSSSSSSSSASAPWMSADRRSDCEPMGPPSSALFPPIDYVPESANARDRARPTPPSDIHQWLRQFQEGMKTQLIAEDILKLFKSNTAADYKQGLDLLQDTLNSPQKPLALLTSLPNSKSFFLLDLLQIQLPTPALKKQLSQMMPAILARVDALPSHVRFGFTRPNANFEDKEQPSLLERVLKISLPTNADDSESLLNRFIVHQVRAYEAENKSIDMKAIFNVVLSVAHGGRAAFRPYAEVVVQLMPVLEMFQTLGLDLESFGSICVAEHRSYMELFNWWLLGEGKRFSMIATFLGVEYMQPGYLGHKVSCHPSEVPKIASVIEQARQQWDKEYLPQLRSMIEVHLIPDLTRIVLQHAMP